MNSWFRFQWLNFAIKTAPTRIAWPPSHLWERIHSRRILGLVVSVFWAIGLVWGALMLFGGEAAAADPWAALQSRFEAHAEPVFEMPERIVPGAAEKTDPWERLQAFLSFTEQEEVAALTDKVVRRRVSGQLHQAVAPYRELILEAAERFEIPPEVIAAVIMVESGGNPRAKASTSSAKGLMQTIDATFAEGRQGLLAAGIAVKNDPFDPRASILAGSWYLARMFDQARSDGRIRGGRNRLDSWRQAAEYYYAGPGHGKKLGDVVVIYAGGRQVVIDKPAYSQKVMRWAGIMKG